MWQLNSKFKKIGVNKLFCMQVNMGVNSGKINKEAYARSLPYMDYWQVVDHVIYKNIWHYT